MGFRLTKIQLFFVAVFVGLVALLVGLMLYSLLGVGYSKETPPIVSSKNNKLVNSPKPDSIVQVAQPEGQGKVNHSAPLEAPDLTREECRLPYNDRVLMEHLEYESVDDDWSQEDYNQFVAERDLEFSRLAASLSQSGDAEHLALAAMLEPNLESKIDLASRAVNAAPENPVVLWNAIATCIDGAACPQQWLEQMADIDSENSLVWMSLAVQQWRNKKTNIALESLSRAASGSQYNSYWVDSIEMALRAIMASGDSSSFQQQADLAFGVAFLPDYGSHLKMCRELSDEHSEAAHDCLRYAERTFELAKTEMDVGIAFSMRSSALEQLGRNGEAVAVRAVKNFWGDYRAQLFEQSEYVELEAYMVDNPANFQSYLNAIRSHGETGARVVLAKEKQAYEKAYLPASCFIAQE